MKTIRVLNPEWVNAPFEEAYFWKPKFTKGERKRFLQARPIRRYKDPEGKVEIPKFILKEEQ